MTGVPRTYWDQAYRSGEFQEQWDYDRPSQELVGALSALSLRAGAAALDLGCGAGRDALYLAQIGLQVAGVDGSREALRIAEGRAAQAGLQVTWVEGDVLSLPFPDRSFELVTDRFCFHHIPEGDRSRYAVEVARVLRPDGHLVLRGSRADRAGSFHAVSEAAVRKHFGGRGFQIGRVLPATLATNSGYLTANMVVLKREARG